MPGPDEQPPPPPPNGRRNEEPQEKHSREPSREPFETHRIETSPDIIHQLLVHPALFDPIRTPRYPIVLCHGQAAKFS
jgi:triacylglycerol lipase